MILANNSHVLIVGSKKSTTDTILRSVKSSGLKALEPVSTAAEALSIYSASHPPLIFLNVQLPSAAGCSDGIDLAYELMLLGASSSPRQVPGIVFTTEKIEIDSFSRACAVRALAYIEMPCDSTCMQQVLQQAMIAPKPLMSHSLTLNQTQTQTLPPIPTPTQAIQPPIEPAVLMPHAASHSIGLGCLFVREGGRLVRLDQTDITCVHVEEKYCVIVIGSGRRYSVRIPLADLLRQLALGDFVRVHRSWLVNLKRIEYIDPVESVIYMAGGTEAPLGRSFRSDLFRTLPIID